MLPTVLPTAPRVAFAADLAAHGDRVALVSTDEQLTYLELAGRVARTAQAWGDQRRLVMLHARNDVDSVVTYLAALAAGHPLLLVGGDQGTSSLVATYQPDLVVGATPTALPPSAPRPGLHPDLALLLSTSGSTGSPKLVRLSHQNVQSNAAAIAKYLGIRATDRAVTTLPMHYCYGLSVINSHLLAGAAVVLTDLSVLDPCLWDLVERHEVSTFAGVPHTFELLDRSGFEHRRLPHLRYVTQAGGRMAPAQVTRWADVGRRRGWDLFVMYGQTEATARMAYLPPDLARSHGHTIGRPIPGGSFTLRPLTEGAQTSDVGELVYTGPGVMLGYATCRADLALGAVVGSLATGDVARRTDDGYFEVLGRRSRFAKLFGLRLDLDHVEAGLAAAGVTAWCVDVEDALVVVTDTRTDARRLQRETARRCGLPVSAVRVHLVARLPRLPSGKPDHAAVRALDELAARPPAPPTPPPTPTPTQTPTPGDLVALFAELLDRPQASADSTFVSLGGDSLSYVEVSVRLEELLGHLPPGWHTTRIADLALVPAEGPRTGRPVETGIALRAVAIVLVVGTHIGLFHLLGGAHVLLALAGFNLARFHLTDDTAQVRLRRGLRSLGRIAAPSVLLIGVAAALTGLYGLRDVLLVDSLLGRTSAGRFWFVETLLHLLVGVLAVLTVPAVHRLERRHDFAVPVALVLAGSLTRLPLSGAEPTPMRLYSAHLVLWLFALGWAAARATTVRRRLVVTALALALVPGFSGSATREGVVLVGLGLLVWRPTVRVPAALVRLTSTLAASSLYIYLAHWHVYPALQPHSPALALVASLAAGTAYWWVFTRAWGAASRAIRRLPRPTVVRPRVPQLLQMTRSSGM